MSLEAKKNRERVRVRVAVTHTSATALQNSRKGKLESGVSSHRCAVLMLCLLPARWGSDVRNGCDPVKGGGEGNFLLLGNGPLRSDGGAALALSSRQAEYANIERRRAVGGEC